MQWTTEMSQPVLPFPAAPAEAPLHGTTVLDFSRYLPGQLCTSILADFGARVVRIENPRDIAKLSAMLNWDGLSPEEKERLKAADSLARNKRSVMVDLGHARAGEALRPLIAGADVIVEDYRAGVLDKLGFGYEAVARINPRLNYCSVSFAGLTGPYSGRAGHDQIALALTGVLSRIGDNPERPGFPNVPLADVMCGLQAAIGVLLAQRTSERSGQGQLIDVAITESLMPFLSWFVSRQASGVRLSERGRSRIDIGMWETQDGRLVCLTNMEPRFWERFCRLIGLPQFTVRQHDEAGFPEMRAAIEPVMRSRPCEEWLALFAEHDIQGAPVNDMAQALDDPHARARGMVVDEGQGRAPRIGNPVHLSLTPALAGVPGEMPGTSSRSLLQAFGHSAERIDEFIAAGCVATAGQAPVPQGKHPA